jgi:hypothetical protein
MDVRGVSRRAPLWVVVVGLALMCAPPAAASGDAAAPTRPTPSPTGSVNAPAAGRSAGVGTTTTTIRGELRLQHVDAAQGRGSPMWTLTAADGLMYPLAADVPSSALWGLEARSVRVTGTLHGGVLAPMRGASGGWQVSADRSPRTTGVQPATGSVGAKSLAVVLIYYGNDPVRYPAQLAPDAYRTQIFGSQLGSLVNVMKAQSQARLNWKGQVYGWWQVPGSNPGTCDLSGWRTAAGAAAAAHGVDLDAFDHVAVVVLDGNCGPAAAGMGDMPGSNVWVFQHNTSVLADSVIYEHELGHNFGLNHASYDGCRLQRAKVGDVPAATVTTAFEGSCSQVEYGDDSDLMGSGRGLSPANRDRLGWMDDGSQVVEASAASVNYRIFNPANALNYEALLVRVPMRTVPPALTAAAAEVGGTGSAELRLDLEYDAAPTFMGIGIPGSVAGVRMRIAPACACSSYSWRVDPAPTPGSPSGALDTALLPGSVFEDPADGLAINVTAANRWFVDLHVTHTRPAPVDPAGTVPLPVVGLRTTAVLATQASVAWDAAATGMPLVGGYQISRWVVGLPLTQLATPTATDTTATLGNLTPGREYWFRIRAVGVTGAPGPWSDPVALTTRWK